MKITLFGLTMFSSNKGCEALCYSFLDLLSEIAQKNNTVYDINLFTLYDEGELPPLLNKWTGLNLTLSNRRFKNKYDMKKLLKSIYTSNFCFDFTEGDSFTDIYGAKRFYVLSLLKILIILVNKKLILGPQTYGPFLSKKTKIISSWILQHSYRLYSRDNESVEFVNKLCNCKILSFTDVAIGLKTNSINFEVNKNKFNIGINVSNLLYNGGYTKNNQFNLTVDYQKYIEELLHSLTQNKNADIYLIPHVINDFNSESLENDLTVCKLLQNKFPTLLIVNSFRHPSDIKSVISKMDIFIGARMHSTIAAFSNEVPVIPFSYSKKFQGLYETFDYKYVIDGKTLETQEAVIKTIDYINKVEELRIDVKTACKKAKMILSNFKNEIEGLINENS